MGTPQTKAPPSVVGIDGIRRSPEHEEQISEAMLATFSDGPGARVLAHLRAVTLNRVLGPGASDAELRQHEGRRELVAQIMQRMDHARAARDRRA
ncbi:hypothetical protein [Elioraea sp.]|uniref:Bbp19 family protein n=1 Tax=Elioraea sp. TaxID=2185103 RepID=UPI0025C1F7A5|nr:hypothetical protein [Elioraea sp.]